jgi:hypothetical protein
MQSGTFDLKQQLFTETITVRIGGQTAQPPATISATPASAWRPPTAVAGQGHAAAAGAGDAPSGAPRRPAAAAGDAAAPWATPRDGARGGAAGAASLGAPCESASAHHAAAASLTMHSGSTRSSMSGETNLVDLPSRSLQGCLHAVPCGLHS